MTQEQLAEAAELHVRTIRGIETRHITAPHRSSVLRITAALRLSIMEEEALLSLWAIPEHSTVVPRRKVFAGHVDNGDELDRRIRNQMRALRLLTLSATTHVGRQRRIAFHDMEASFVATKNRVRARWIFVQPDDPTVQLDGVTVTDLRGCTLGETALYPDDGIKAVELRLPDELREGQTATMRYRIDYRQALGSGCHPELGATKSMDGFLLRAASYVAEVRFDKQALPRHCDQVFQTRPGLRPSRIRQLEPNSWHVVQAVVVAPEPGAYGIQWEW